MLDTTAGFGGSGILLLIMTGRGTASHDEKQYPAATETRNETEPSRELEILEADLGVLRNSFKFGETRRYI